MRDFLNFKLHIRRCLFAPNLNIFSWFCSCCFCCSSIWSTLSRNLVCQEDVYIAVAKFGANTVQVCTCCTFKSWLKISDWLVPVVSFHFCSYFIFFSWHQCIHHHVNIWTEHWQAGAAQLPMWGAPCILQVRIHCLYFVESFAFETTINTICCNVH